MFLVAPPRTCLIGAHARPPQLNYRVYYVLTTALSREDSTEAVVNSKSSDTVSRVVEAAVISCVESLEC